MSAQKNTGLKIPLARTGGRAVLPDGVYRLRIEKAEEKMGPSGSPYINLTMNVLDSKGKPSNTKVWDVLSLNPKARFKIDQFLDSVNADDTGNVTLGWFINQSMWVALTSDTYQGVVKNVVERYITEEDAEKRLRDQSSDNKEDFVMPSAETDDDYEDILEDESEVEVNFPEDLAAEEDIPF